MTALLCSVACDLRPATCDILHFIHHPAAFTNSKSQSRPDFICCGCTNTETTPALLRGQPDPLKCWDQASFKSASLQVRFVPIVFLLLWFIDSSILSFLQQDLPLLPEQHTNRTCTRHARENHNATHCPSHCPTGSAPSSRFDFTILHPKHKPLFYNGAWSLQAVRLFVFFRRHLEPRTIMS